MCFVLLFVINIVGSLVGFSLCCVVLGWENVYCKMINNENVNLILK